MPETWIYSLGSLLFVAFHLTALILALIFWRRHPSVSLLVLLGSLLNLLATAGRIFLPAFWFQHFDDRISFAFVNLGLSLVNIFGSVLYLTAVFTGRNTPMPRTDRWPAPKDDRRNPPANLPSRPGSTEIRE